MSNDVFSCDWTFLKYDISLLLLLKNVTWVVPMSTMEGAEPELGNLCPGFNYLNYMGNFSNMIA